MNRPGDAPGDVVDVLVLHGSPGSGKTTLSRTVSELLRELDIPHAVIDLDDLNMVHPSQPPSFALVNLRALWPNYAAVPGLKLILPTVISTVKDCRIFAAPFQGVGWWSRS